MSLPRLLPALTLLSLFSACTLQSTSTHVATPLPGRTDSLGDPGYIGANGALHKNVIAGDYFGRTELAQMELRGHEVIPITVFNGVPKPAAASPAARGR